MKLVEKDGAIRFEVHAKPRAKRSKVGERGDAVEISLAAPPVDGAANAELLRFMAEVLDVPKRGVSLMRGDGSREKRLAIVGLSAAAVEARFRSAVVPSKPR